MTQIEIPAVGNLVTFFDPKTLTPAHPGEVLSVEDVTYPDLGGTPRRHITLWVYDRLTCKTVCVKLSGIVSDLGPLRL